MSNSYINIRFGCHHFQLNRPLEFRWTKNVYWEENKPDSWFKVYEFFWYKGF